MATSRGTRRSAPLTGRNTTETRCGAHCSRRVVDVGVTIEHVPARRATGSVLAVLGLRTAAAACGLVVTVVLTRHLGPSRFGELSLVLTVWMMASAAGELGTTSVVAAEMAARPERRRELAAGFAALRAVAGAVLAAAGAVLLAVTLDRPTAQLAGMAVMAAVPLVAISALVVLAQARLRPEIGAALSFGQSASWLVAVSVAAAAGADLPVIGGAFLVCALGQAAATWFVVVRPERPAWARWRGAVRWTLRRSWPLAAATVLGAAYYRLDGILVFQLRGEAEAGVYGAAYRFLDVSQLIPVAIVSVLLPVLARRWALNDARGFAFVLRLGVTAGAAVGALVAATAVVCGDRVAVAVFGDGFAASGDVLRVLGLAVFSLATGYVYAAAAIATGDVKVVGLTSAGALVLSVAAGIPATEAWGAEGAAWVTVATEFFASTSIGLWVHRRHGAAYPLRRVGASVAAAAVTIALGWPLRSLPVAALVAVCLVAYGTAAAVLRALTRDDVRALLHPRQALGESP